MVYYIIESNCCAHISRKIQVENEHNKTAKLKIARERYFHKKKSFGSSKPEEMHCNKEFKTQ